jgi:AraC family transcriptional regulator
MIRLGKCRTTRPTIMGPMCSIMVAEAQAERLDEVRRFVRDHADEPLDRARLAALSGFSVPHFHRLWRAHAGENIAAYVRRLRLKRAALKLRMGAVDLTEVALRAGYETHAAFTRAFKQQYGLNPSDFRNLDCWAATRMVHERG